MCDLRVWKLCCGERQRNSHPRAQAVSWGAVGLCVQSRAAASVPDPMLYVVDMRTVVAALLAASFLGCSSSGAPAARGPAAASVSEPAVATDPNAAPAPAARSTRADIQLEDVSPAQASSELGNRVRDTVRGVAEACAGQMPIAPTTRVRVVLVAAKEETFRAHRPEAEALSAIDDRLLECLLDGVRSARLHGRRGEVGPPSVIVTWEAAAR